MSNDQKGYAEHRRDGEQRDIRYNIQEFNRDVFIFVAERELGKSKSGM